MNIKDIKDIIIDRWVIIDNKYVHFVFSKDRTYIDGIDTEFKSNFPINIQI